MSDTYCLFVYLSIYLFIGTLYTQRGVHTTPRLSPMLFQLVSLYDTYYYFCISKYSQTGIGASQKGTLTILGTC